MKLATMPGSTPDGTLVIVSRDLSVSVPANDIAPTMVEAIQDWDLVIAALTERFDRLQAGELGDAVRFEPAHALAPLPRAPQWLDGSVFQTHLDLMAKALHPDKPNEPGEYPLIYQGASDDLRGSVDPIEGFRFEEGIDFEGEFGVIVDDVAMRSQPDASLNHVKLLTLINDVSLRSYAGSELRSGFGFVNAKPSTAFAPVVVTPDELGDRWAEGRVHLRLQVERNGEWFGHPHGEQMSYHFGELIAHAARTRRLSAGTIIGSGTVSNDADDAGSACIAEQRAIEMIATGSASTPFLSDGEEVQMQVLDDSGQSIFGSIRQRVSIGTK